MALVANKLEDMEVVNPLPALRTRPAGLPSRPTSKSEVALKKAEASVQRRLHERTALELASQRFKLPAGKKRFSKTEVLSLGKCAISSSPVRDSPPEPSACAPHH